MNPLYVSEPVLRPLGLFKGKRVGFDFDQMKRQGRDGIVTLTTPVFGITNELVNIRDRCWARLYTLFREFL